MTLVGCRGAGSGEELSIVLKTVCTCDCFRLGQFGTDIVVIFCLGPNTKVY